MPSFDRDVLFSPTAVRRRVLLAEDDGPMRSLLAGYLRRDGLEVFEASSGAELRRLLHDLEGQGSSIADLIITDNRMPGVSGLEILRDLRCFDSVTPIILITAFADEDVVNAAADLDVALFDKPFDLDDLRTAAHILANRPRR